MPNTKNEKPPVENKEETTPTLTEEDLRFINGGLAEGGQEAGMMPTRTVFRD